MKKLLFALLAVIGLSVSTFAQAEYKPIVLLNIDSLETTITNSATSNYTATASVRGMNTVGVGVKVQLNGSGTSGNIFKFAKSADGQNFETTPSILITNASAGATETFYFNKVDVAGAAAIRLTSVVNGSAAALTNLSVTVFGTK